MKGHNSLIIGSGGVVTELCEHRGYDQYMTTPSQRPTRARVLRALVEMGFIVFLFYANLLMGEFTGLNGHGKTLAFAISDIFTVINFAVAILSSLVGYVIFEYLRKLF